MVVEFAFRRVLPVRLTLPERLVSPETLVALATTLPESSTEAHDVPLSVTKAAPVLESLIIPALRPEIVNPPEVGPVRLSREPAARVIAPKFIVVEPEVPLVRATFVALCAPRVVLANV